MCSNLTIFLSCQVTELPWNQDELAAETLPFVDKLAHVNKHGILTINSQPNVNAVPSTDPVAGWGRPGGYIFQKVNIQRNRGTLYNEPHYNEVPDITNSLSSARPNIQ